MPRNMTRTLLLVAALSAALALPALAATGSASPAAGSSPQAQAAVRCTGVIHLGGKRFAMYKHRVTCDGARRALRTLYATRGRRGTPRGFKCRSASRFRKNAGCKSSSGRRYFGYSR
jgi:hypothetical protein